MARHRFRIHVFQRFYLIFVPFLLLVLLGLKLWVMFERLAKPSRWDPLFIILVIGLVVLAALHLIEWYSFEVELSEDSIRISKAQMKWEDLHSVRTKLASRFSSFSALFELRSKDGQVYKIPACIEKSLLLLQEIRKHLPNETPRVNGE
jgi:hypothetical protein